MSPDFTEWLTTQDKRHIHNPTEVNQNGPGQRLFRCGASGEYVVDSVISFEDRRF
ncbi:hypothetical protein [Mesorhizobium hawassense]|uniref:hypothetical protein n=1 Tax=Mesorhizobium hawassense TaxID=1209954 RepID=UPI00142E1C86|nr:hypothetical protein [Mesorhizobium hawassense]